MSLGVFILAYPTLGGYFPHIRFSGDDREAHFCFRGSQFCCSVSVLFSCMIASDCTDWRSLHFCLQPSDGSLRGTTPVSRHQNSQKHQPNIPPSVSSSWSSSQTLPTFPPNLPLPSNTKDNSGAAEKHEEHDVKNPHFIYTRHGFDEALR